MKVKIEIELDTTEDEEQLRDLVKTLGAEIFAVSAGGSESSDSEAQFLTEQTPLPPKKSHSRATRGKGSGSRATRGKANLGGTDPELKPIPRRRSGLQFTEATEAQHTAKIESRTADSTETKRRSAETSADNTDQQQEKK